jgi:hypothetical protein
VRIVQRVALLLEETQGEAVTMLLKLIERWERLADERNEYDTSEAFALCAREARSLLGDRDDRKVDLWTRLSESVDYDREIESLTDHELAKRLENALADTDIFSREYSLIETILARLDRSNGGPCPMPDGETSPAYRDEYEAERAQERKRAQDEECDPVCPHCGDSGCAGAVYHPDDCPHGPHGEDPWNPKGPINGTD